MKPIFLALASVFIGLQTSAQHSMILYNMDAIPQSNQLNPAIVPLSRGNVSLPGAGSIYLNGSRNDFLIQEAFTSSEGETSFDSEVFVNGLENSNFFDGQMEMNMLNIGFAAGRNYFSFGATEHFSFFQRFPKSSAVFVKEVLDSEVLSSNLEIKEGEFETNFQHYRTFYFTLAREFSEKLSVGASIKLYNGISAIETETFRGNFTGDLSTGQFQGTVGGRIYSSGMSSYFDPNEATSLISDLRNNSLGFDVGFAYQPNDKFQFTASAIDIGAGLTWKKGNENYLDQTIDVSFDAIEILSVQSGDGTDQGDALRDSVGTSFEDATSTSEEFKTSIPTRIYVSAGWNITQKTQFSLLTHMVMNESETNTFMRVAMQTRMKKFLSLIAQYSLVDENDSPVNLGVGLSLNFGFIQIYALTENVLVPFLEDQKHNYQGRFGVNFTFGRDNK